MKKLIVMSALSLALTACGGNEQVRDDPQPTGAPPAEPAAAPAGEPDAAPAEPEPVVEAPKYDESAFKGQGRVTAGKNAAGESAFKVSKVKDGSGWAKCGIQSGDVLVSVGGKAIAKDTLPDLYDACTNGGADIMVERGGNPTKVGPLASE